MNLCPRCSHAQLCPRCNQWRTPSQISPSGVCGACQCEGPECHQPKSVRRLCAGHYSQWKRTGTLTPLRPKAPGRPVADLLEDLTILAGTDTVDNVAARLGMKPDSIWRALHRAGRDDMWRKLRGAAA